MVYWEGARLDSSQHKMYEVEIPGVVLQVLWKVELVPRKQKDRRPCYYKSGVESVANVK